MQYLNDIFVQFFNFIHGSVTNFVKAPELSYGLAIILFTLIIRIIILPLNIKQNKSAIKTSEIQPELNKLKEKYKNDPQRLQQHTMKLYKEKGISPLGGCLPVLVQWPIFIALYSVFNTLTGINGVSFLWVKDLAKPDIILAIISGASTYFSTAVMAPSSGSQATQMKTMNVSMSIVMLFMSWKFKAALVLYWVTNNLVQLIQMLVMKKIYSTPNNI